MANLYKINTEDYSRLKELYDKIIDRINYLAEYGTFEELFETQVEKSKIDELLSKAPHADTLVDRMTIAKIRKTVMNADLITA